MSNRPSPKVTMIIIHNGKTWFIQQSLSVSDDAFLLLPRIFILMRFVLLNGEVYGKTFTRS